MKKIIITILAILPVILHAQVNAKKDATAKEALQAYLQLSESKEGNAADLEKAFHKWEHTFGVSPDDEAYNFHYALLYSKIAARYAKEGNKQQFEETVGRLESLPGRSIAMEQLTKQLVNDSLYTYAAPFLEESYRQALQLPQDAKNRDVHISNVGDNYAKTLLSVGRVQEAYDIAGASLPLCDQIEVFKIESLTLSYAQAAVKLGKYAEAMNTLQDYVLVNGRKPAHWQMLLDVYAQIEGDKQDIPGYIAYMDNKADALTREKFRSEIVKREAPDFTLQDKDGKSVSLKDLRGKIVILDFWATWCTPCKASFPGMQAAVDKYAADEDVVFLFIDTKERQENYMEMATRYIQDHNYSFHVLFDEMKDVENAMATAYGVTGIPNKIVIDKDGFIRFQTLGSKPDVDLIVREISAKIELIKNL